MGRDVADLVMRGPEAADPGHRAVVELAPPRQVQDSGQSAEVLGHAAEAVRLGEGGEHRRLGPEQEAVVVGVLA